MRGIFFCICSGNGHHELSSRIVIEEWFLQEITASGLIIINNVLFFEKKTRKNLQNIQIVRIFAMCFS